MAVKFKLDRLGHVKYGYVGFSYTTFYFKAFVAMVREDWKMFFKLFLLYLITGGIIVFINYFPFAKFIYEEETFLTKIAELLLDFKYRYIFLTINIFLQSLYLVTIFVWIYIANRYNKYYTQRLLEEGFLPQENDDYALAILKNYAFLDYTEEEKNNEEKMNLYRNIIDTVKKEEKRKKYLLVSLYVFFLVAYFLSTVIEIGNFLDMIGDLTYYELIQAGIFY